MTNGERAELARIEAGLKTEIKTMTAASERIAKKFAAAPTRVSISVDTLRLAFRLRTVLDTAKAARSAVLPAPEYDRDLGLATAAVEYASRDLADALFEDIGDELLSKLVG